MQELSRDIFLYWDIGDDYLCDIIYHYIGANKVILNKNYYSASEPLRTLTIYFRSRDIS